ncbi:hypothetical protein [Stenotrophomonas sepilia]
MDFEQRARELLASCLDEWGHHQESENVREGEDLESYEFELRLIGQLLRFGFETGSGREAVALTPPEGHLVVTRNEAGQAVAVTRQDDEGRILSVIAEFEIPRGYVLVPVEPTIEMLVDGHESEPDEFFSKPEDWLEYEAMSGCQQGHHRARLCWAAMLAARPEVNP